MRIVRTETYVDAEDAKFGQGARKLEGFGAAWITKPSHRASEPEFSAFDDIFLGSARRPRWRTVGSISPDRSEDFLPPFIEICLRNLPRPRSVEGYFNIATSGDAAVEYILAQPIVIEYSPPEWVHLLDFIKSASPALLLSAYFIGVRNTSLLLVARVAAGYILLSSAIGLSKWLEDGQFINLIDNLFH